MWILNYWKFSSQKSESSAVGLWSLKTAYQCVSSSSALLLEMPCILLMYSYLHRSVSVPFAKHTVFWFKWLVWVSFVKFAVPVSMELFWTYFEILLLSYFRAVNYLFIFFCMYNGMLALVLIVLYTLGLWSEVWGVSFLVSFGLEQYFIKCCLHNWNFLSWGLDLWNVLCTQLYCGIF